MVFDCAITWYQKKIGAYDKQLWEKTVEEKILQGVNPIPKKTTKLKTGLIDVDLVRGSAFTKAKPEQSWIAVTSTGVVRVLLLPLFLKWWQQQTCTFVSISLLILYGLHLAATCLYFVSSEDELSNVVNSEVITPIIMMVSLGVVHSHVVATFTSKTGRNSDSNRRKSRKRPQRKVRARIAQPPYLSQSSTEVLHEDRKEQYPEKPNNPLKQNGEEEKLLIVKDNENYKDAQVLCKSDPPELPVPLDTGVSCSTASSNSDKSLPVIQENAHKNSDEESGLDSSDLTQVQEDYILESVQRNVTSSSCPKDCPTVTYSDQDKFVKFCPCNHSSPLLPSSQSPPLCCNLITKAKYGHLLDDGNSGDISSGEEYFIAAKQLKCSYGKCKEMTYIASQRKQSREVRNPPLRTSRSGASSSNGYRARSFSDAANGNIPHLDGCRERVLMSRRFSDSRMNFQKCCGSFEQREDGIDDSQRQLNGSCDENGHDGNDSQIPLALHIPAGSSARSCSSCDSEGETTSPTTPTKGHTSDLDWPLLNSDCNSDSSDSLPPGSPGDIGEFPSMEDPFSWDMQEVPIMPIFTGGHSGSDKGRWKGTVSCTIWEDNECKKVDLTVLDISSSIIRKVDLAIPNSEYLSMGLVFAVIMALLPSWFRLHNGSARDIIQDVTTDVFITGRPSTYELTKVLDLLQDSVLGTTWRVRFIVLVVALQRFVLSFLYFFLLSVAERTFKQRFLYAKHFCHLTSSRRARRSELPHFRLNKVRNIKTWLSVRSYLRKHGPQRSVDMIVSTAFIIIVCLLSFLCFQILKETEQFSEKLYCWETVSFSLALGIFLMRFMILGSKINKKYGNLSVLITEQINLYLHMEQKPHKKEELMLANNVLKLAADLLKELGSPFKISGLCANPYLYNITRVVILSAFSAVLTELLGFKLKLLKIKIK